MVRYKKKERRLFLNNPILYDINEVCKLLGTTSRTLRFYEEKKIIESTKYPTSNRRQYTKEQINHIKNVMVLRTLGLSIKEIAKIQQENGDLKSIILMKRAEIFASIETKKKEINLLNEALAMLESGKDIFENDLEHSFSTHNTNQISIVKKCSNAIVFEQHSYLYSHFSTQLTEYMPLAIYIKVRADTFLPLGKFLCFDKIEQHKKHSNILLHYIKYENLGLKISYVFHEDKIHGLWFDYYEPFT